MMALLSPKVWIALALAAFLAFTHTMAYRNGSASKQAQWDAAKVVQQQALADAEKASRTKEQALQRTKDEAVNAAAEREKKLRADAARGSAERDGLRRELAASRGLLSSASPDSLRKRVTALEDVFEQCSGSYIDLAAKADRHASDALTLQQAWPK